MNVTNQDQVMSEGQPAVWGATIDDQEPQLRRKQGLYKQLKELLAGARQNLKLK
jgi:hypothetical protein